MQNCIENLCINFAADNFALKKSHVLAAVIMKLFNQKINENNINQAFEINAYRTKLVSSIQFGLLLGNESDMRLDILIVF